MGLRSRLDRAVDLLPIATYYGLFLLLCGLIFISSADSGAVCMSMPLFLLVFALWVIQLVKSIRRRKQGRAPMIGMRVLLPAVLVVMVIVLDGKNATFNILWWMSRPWLDDLARRVMGTPDGTVFPPTTLGAFHASEIEKVPGGFRFRSRYGHPFDWNGFAYFPDGKLYTDSRDPAPPEHIYEAIGGGWYRYTRF